MSVMSEWAYLRTNDAPDHEYSHTPGWVDESASSLGWWPPLPGERDEDGELVPSLPETTELREWWPIDREGDAR